MRQSLLVGRLFNRRGVGKGDPPPTLVVASYADGTDNFHINGQAPHQNTISLNTGTGYGLLFGSRVKPDEYGKFDALEVMAFSTALTQEERQLVECYLAHKWAFTSELPADHPFKSVPPSADGRGKVSTLAAASITPAAATLNGGLLSTGIGRRSYGLLGRAGRRERRRRVGNIPCSQPGS